MPFVFYKENAGRWRVGQWVLPNVIAFLAIGHAAPSFLGDALMDSESLWPEHRSTVLPINRYRDHSVSELCIACSQADFKPLFRLLQCTGKGVQSPVQFLNHGMDSVQIFSLAPLFQLASDMGYVVCAKIGRRPLDLVRDEREVYAISILESPAESLHVGHISFTKQLGYRTQNLRAIFEILQNLRGVAFRKFGLIHRSQPHSH